MHLRIFVTSVAALFLLGSAAAFGANGEKAEVKGMINSRTGDTMAVKSSQGTSTVVLTDNTVTKDDRGVFGLQKEHLSNVVLIPERIC